MLRYLQPVIRMAGGGHSRLGRECECVFIKDIFSSLDRYEDCLVSVSGTVVDVVMPNSQLSPNRPLVLSLDDGTGEVRCVFFGFQNYKHLTSVTAGQTFLARGLVSLYRDELQIKCETLKIVTDPNFETLWINKVLYEKKRSDK